MVKKCLTSTNNNLSNNSFVTGNGVIVINMPNPKSISVSKSSSKIAHILDMSTSAQFYIASSIVLDITVYYDDGSVKSFSTPYFDNRITIKVLNNNNNLNICIIK